MELRKSSFSIVVNTALGARRAAIDISITGKAIVAENTLAAQTIKKVLDDLTITLFVTARDLATRNFIGVQKQDTSSILQTSSLTYGEEDTFLSVQSRLRVQLIPPDT